MSIASKIIEYIDSSIYSSFSVLSSLNLTSDNSLRVILSRMLKKGEINSPKKGLYASLHADPFLISTLINQGYVSLSSAYYLHGLITEYPFTIFIGSEVSESLRFGEHNLRYFIADNYKGLLNKDYRIAGVEKAVYDGLKNPGLVDYRTTLRAFFHSSKFDVGLFLRICSNEPNSFYQRLGYLLSLLPEKSSSASKLISICRKRVKSVIYLNGRSKGNYNHDWKLVDNIGSGVLLSWYQ